MKVSITHSMPNSAHQGRSGTVAFGAMPPFTVQRLALLLCCVMTALAFAAYSAPLKAEGAVTPSEIQLAIQPTWSDQAQFDVDLPPSTPRYEPLDIVFVFDATQSMTNVIGDFQRSVDRILGDISARTTNVRYAVVEFGDYQGIVRGCDPAPGLPVWRLVSGFTSDPSAAKAAVRQVGVKWNGCDNQEAYLRALDEVRRLDWRKDATRYVVLLGDAPTRSPDPGRDGRLQTADDLSTEDVVAAYRREGITVLGIYIGSEDGAVAQDFAALANDTPNGMTLSLSGDRNVADLIEQGLTQIPPPAPLMRAISPAFRDWISPGERAGLDAKGQEHRFDFELSPPDGTVHGIYTINLEAITGPSQSGPRIGTGTVTVRVGWEYYPLKPLLIWPIALLCLLALTAILYVMARTQQWNLQPGGRAIKPLKYSGRELQQVAMVLGLTALVTTAGIKAYEAAPEDLSGWFAVQKSGAQEQFDVHKNHMKSKV